MQCGASESHEVVNVQPQICRSAEVLVPVPTLAPLPEESTEDWDERIGDLFEWVGMACLGAQRFVSYAATVSFQAILTKRNIPDSKQTTVWTHTSPSTNLSLLHILAT